MKNKYETENSENVLNMKKFPLWYEIVSGIVFGFLNVLFSLISAKLEFPLFLDTIFTVAASFTGWWSGIISAVVFHVFSIIATNAGQWSGMFFILCSFAIVLIIRLFVRNKTEIRLPHLIILWVLCAIIISLVGAAVYTFIFAAFDYQECVATRFMTYILLQQRIPVLLSSFISRIPVNCLDKAISVFAGFGIYHLSLKAVKNSEKKI